MSSSIKKKAKANTAQTTDVTELIMKIVTVTFIFAVFIIIPIGFKNYYFDIGEFKAKLFFAIFITYVLLMTILLVPYLIVHIKNGMWKGRTFKIWVKELSILDWFMLAYAVICIISFFGSEYHTMVFFKDSFTDEIFDNPAWYGFKDWWMGLRTQLLLVASYFYVSRFFVKDFLHFPYVVWIFGVISFIFLLAILNRVNIDPFGFYDGLSIEYKLKFLTTLGQTSWYSSFLITVIPIGVGLYFFSDTIVSKVMYGIYLCLGFMTLMSQDSDSAYIALAALFVTLFMFAFRDNQSMKNFLEIMLIMLLPVRFMGFLMKHFADPALQLNTLSQIMLHNNALWIIIILVLAAYIFLIYNDKTDANGKTKKKFEVSSIIIVRNIIFVICIASIPIILIVIVLATKDIIHIPESVPFGIRNYLIFDSRWGNTRGGIWRLSKDVFKSFKPFYKLFGCGPDTMGYYVYVYFMDRIFNYWYSDTEFIVNGHNEWFTALVNTGFFGGVAYLGIFVSGFVACIKNTIRKSDGFIFAVSLSVVSYVFHGLFCYQTVLNTPFIFVELAMAAYLLRCGAKEEA